jgi:hypothetical protein
MDVKKFPQNLMWVNNDGTPQHPRATNNNTNTNNNNNDNVGKNENRRVVTIATADQR